MTQPPPIPKPPEPISVTYSSTFVDHLRCNLFAAVCNQQFLLVMGVCVLATSYTLPLPRLDDNFLINAVLRLVLTAIGFICLNFIIMLSAIVNRVRKGPARRSTSTLTAEGIVDVMPEKRQVLLWKNTTWLRENKGDIHVGSGIKGVYIPRSAFRDVDEARRFGQIARELWQSKGACWPEVAGRSWRSAGP